LNQQFNVIANVIRFASVTFKRQKHGVVLMPYHENGSLKNLIDKHRSDWRKDSSEVHEKRSVLILKQQLQAAKILDELDIVHNDFKP